MGPTNVALVKYFQADQELREAKERLDAASKDVRVQERRVNDAAEKHRLAQQRQREAQAKAATLDLDLKARDAHIEKLRTQQQNAKNNKEYQTFLIEINTQKVDRNKIEDEAMKLLESVERGNKELGEFSALMEGERAKLVAMKEQIGDRLAALQKDIDDIRPKVEEAGKGVPTKAREAFERLNDRLDGEAMAAISKPDRRREEYVCTACNMDLVVDVYNKLHSRDELVFCPSCRRILYIPDDLPPEVAIKGKPAASATASTKQATGEPKAPRRASTRAKAADPITKVLTKAAGESVRNAVAAGNDPVECEIYLDGKLIGVFKGQNPDNLARTAKFCLNEAGIAGDVNVVQKSAAAPAPNASSSEAPAEPPESTEGSAEAAPAPADAAAPVEPDTNRADTGAAARQS
jgi:predicted  nucleic acid-binding Zn-ribbon protein